MALTDSRDNVSIESDLDLAEKDPTYTRRQFLKWGIYAVGGAVTIAIGVPTVLYFINPALKGASSNKILVKLGEVSKFSNATTPQTVSSDYKYTDSFKQVDGTKQVFVRAKKAGATAAADFQILDPTCTHLGCAVTYNPPGQPKGKDKFFCFCHQSVYDIDGKNIAGPAPKPLFSYTVDIVDGQLAINVAEFTG
jgi:Rieske Fe-S protein